MTKKIYLIRHGQTDYNLRGIVQGGSVDTHLNETGRTQANSFFTEYQSIPFDKIYTSALRRSIQSVQGFIDTGIPHEAHKGLNEISWGDKDGKIVNTGDNNEYLNLIQEWNKGNIDAKIPSGESPREVQTRIQSVLNIILSKEDEKNILICMHGRAMRILLATALEQNLDKMDEYEHGNLCLYLLEYQEGKFSIVKYNDHSHLPK